MSQAVSIPGKATSRRVLDRIVAYLPHLDRESTEFGLKTAIAVMTAVAIEFWFDLGMAGSAVLTVLIVKSQLLGTTLGKSVLRMIGNLIGCCIGLAFIALAAQDRIAAATLFTTYSVFCCFHLQRSRFAPAWHWAYTSAGLVFLTNVSAPTNAFTYTTERWLEIAIGISVTSVVSSVLWPSRAGTVFERHFTALLANLAGSIAATRDALLSTDTAKQPAAPGRLAAEIAPLHVALHTASRDTSRYERFHDGYDALINRIQVLVARSVLLANAVSRLNRTTDNLVRKSHSELVAAVFDHLQTSTDTLVEIAKQHFDNPATPTHSLDTTSIRSTVDRIRAGIRKADYNFRDAAAMLYVCETITSLADEIDRFADELANVERKSDGRSKLSAVQPLDMDDTPLWKRVDVRKSLASGLIIAIAFAAWILTNWPSGSLGVFFALLVTSKNCTAPYLPPKAMLPGGILAIFVGGFIYFCVLPRLDGFGQLAIVLFPFYTVCGYLMLSSSARTAGLVSLTAILATMVFGLEQHQSFSFAHVVGMAYADLGGMSLAFIALTCVWPIVPEQKFTSQAREFFRSCGNAMRAAIQPTSSVTKHAATRSPFGATFSRQLRLCGLWSRLIHYARLPPSSRAAVVALTAAMQSVAVQLVFPDGPRAALPKQQQTESISGIVRQLQQQCADTFVSVGRALDECENPGKLPDFGMTLNRLQDKSRELCETIADEQARRATMCRLLEVSGRYAAMTDAIADCHQRVDTIDWRKLNHSYF